jgi:hypothetical protein
MHRGRVGDIHRKRDFEAATGNISVETRDCADLKRNSVAIPVFIPQFFRRSLKGQILTVMGVGVEFLSQRCTLLK